MPSEFSGIPSEGEKWEKTNDPYVDKYDEPPIINHPEPIIKEDEILEENPQPVKKEEETSKETPQEQDKTDSNTLILEQITELKSGILLAQEKVDALEKLFAEKKPDTNSDKSQNVSSDTREKVINDWTHGKNGERATWRDDKMKFASRSQEGAHLYATPDQIESARKEMEDDMKKREAGIQYDDPNKLQDALDPNRKRENPLQDVKDILLPEQIKRQEEFAKRVEETRLANDPLYKKTPEITKVETIDPNKEKRERNLKRVAMIAGVVVGAGTALAVGSGFASLGVFACMGAGLLNKGIDSLGASRINKISEQLKNTTDPELKAKLEKRIANWEKIRTGTKYIDKFLKGASIGLFVGGIGSAIFMQGHGLLLNTQEASVLPGSKSGEQAVDSRVSETSSGNSSVSENISADSIVPENISTDSSIAQSTSESLSNISTETIDSSWMGGETFNASDLGWDSNQMGWLGDKVYLTDAGGNSGVLQGNFFKELAKLVTKEQLIGQESGNIVNQYLRSAYGGMNPSDAASKAAELILGK